MQIVIGLVVLALVGAVFAPDNKPGNNCDHGENNSRLVCTTVRGDK